MFLISFVRHIATILWAFFEKSTGSNTGVSARRLTAFNVVLIYDTARIISIAKINDPYWIAVGYWTDAAFVLLLFGIITLQQISELKNGKEVKPNTDVQP